eukprot:Skav227351  [mRNA]  locus=scaffold1665:115538:116446:+ [translate_table: standard]
MRAQIDQLMSEKSGMEDDIQRLRSENEVLKSPKTTKVSQTSEPQFDRAPSDRASGRGSGGMQLQRGLTGAIVRQHQNMREMNADTILNKLDLDERENARQLFKETDMRRMIKESNTDYLGSELDDEESIEMRRREMSRVEILREWLQSNTYEMIMAICINVVWMAIELQFHGLVSGYKIGVYPEAISTATMCLGAPGFGSVEVELLKELN